MQKRTIHERVTHTAAYLVVVASFALLAFPSAFAQSTTASTTPSTTVKTIRDCADCPEMMIVAAGSFEMGSSLDERIREGVPPRFADRETIVHRVTISKPFAMSRNEITRGMYAKFVAETKRPDPAACGVFNPDTDSWKERPGYSWRNTGFEQTDEHPVVCISFNDAHEFAAWLAQKTGKKYRLATEAEWEYAARGGTTTARYWGDAAEPGCELANIMTAATFAKLGSPKSWTNKLVCTAPHSFTMPVGSFPSNPFGLNDMIGNAYEWIADCFHPTYAGAPVDGSAWLEPDCKQQMLRGGAFHSSPWLARIAARGGPVEGDYHPLASGIRVVRDLP